MNFAFLPTALRNQVDSPTKEDEDGDEGYISTVRPHTGSTTAKSNTSQSGKSSLLYYVITSSPANMPGQWHGSGRTTGHSTSMCPVLFITLHKHSAYSSSSLTLPHTVITNMTRPEMLHNAVIICKDSLGNNGEVPL